MQQFEVSQASGRRPSKRGFFSRIVLPMILFLGIIACIAWVVQNLPRWRTKPVARRPVAERKTPWLNFDGNIAYWPTAIQDRLKEFEPGTKGHFDFPFRNDTELDIDIGLLSITCDCSSVLIAVLSEEQWEDFRKFRAKQPGETFTYSPEPGWRELERSVKSDKGLTIKSGERGIVRVQWTARKAIGQELKIQPTLWTQPAADDSQRVEQNLYVYGLMAPSVRFHPTRVNIGAIAPGRTAKAEFEAWSSTRESFELKLAEPAVDPLFPVTMRPLSVEERKNLEKELSIVTGPQSDVLVPTTRVLSGYLVTFTVHEQVGEHQLVQGSFYRKLPVLVDGLPDADVQGPEIVGQVQSDIIIGGANDKNKIIFKPAKTSEGASKIIELATNAKHRLELHHYNPPILEVDVKPIANSPGRWRLKVTVPPNAHSGPFTDADAVTLRVVGERPRLVRIPLEGNFGD